MDCSVTTPGERQQVLIATSNQKISTTFFEGSLNSLQSESYSHTSNNHFYGNSSNRKTIKGSYQENPEGIIQNITTIPEKTFNDKKVKKLLSKAQRRQLKCTGIEKVESQKEKTSGKFKNNNRNKSHNKGKSKRQGEIKKSRPSQVLLLLATKAINISNSVISSVNCFPISHPSHGSKLCCSPGANVTRVDIRRSCQGYNIGRKHEVQPRYYIQGDATTRKSDKPTATLFRSSNQLLLEILSRAGESLVRHWANIRNSITGKMLLIGSTSKPISHKPQQDQRNYCRESCQSNQEYGGEHRMRKSQRERERNRFKSSMRRRNSSNCSFGASADTLTLDEINLSPNHCNQHIRHSLSLYAASSFLLVLCYLTTTSSATSTQSDASPLDKHPIFDESSSDKEILDLLLEKKRYDKRLLPPVNDEDFCCGLLSPDMAKNQNARRPHNRGTLTVNVNVLLLSLASPDESSLKYEVEFLLNQQWNDPRLQYGNKSQYDFLNALHHHDSIWTPDTYFIMHGDFKDPIIPMHFALRIYRNGTITYAMRRHLILSCQGSLHIFPFDDPKCSFSMESISYEEPQIKYVWKNDEDTLRKSPSLTTLNAYLIKNQTTACDQNSWRGNYSCLRVDLIFTRDRAFYFTTVFIPGIILVTSSFITFWLEWNAVPARSMIGVTTMLNFFTTSNGFRSTLPVVSNLTAMNVWDGVCMCFIYASLLEFVCVNYVGRKRPLHNVVYRPGENPVTQRLPAVLSRIGVILASPLAAAGLSTPSHTAEPSTPKPPHESIGWEDQHGGGFSSIDQQLRTEYIKRQESNKNKTACVDSQHSEPFYSEPILVKPMEYESGGATSGTTTTIEVEGEIMSQDDKLPSTTSQLRQKRSISTSTPKLILGKDDIQLAQWHGPLKPPRRKTSRSASPTNAGSTAGLEGTKGEKRRDAGAPNEIVACTTCGGNSSPCTHSANNGCATETCFVQVRKKEPPHPIRVAKTIDVIARITFPTAYAIFLIFFFVHYKGFS